MQVERVASRPTPPACPASQPIETDVTQITYLPNPRVYAGSLSKAIWIEAVRNRPGEEVTLRQAGSPMQLTRAADYGIRAMVHLASLPQGSRAQLSSISAATDAPPPFLSKVLQALTRAHMVASSRGASGGFQALASGRKASLRQLIEAIDGPISLNACVLAGDNCQRKTHCPAHPVWLRAQHAMIAVLSATTIAELATRPSATVPAPGPTQCATPTSDRRHKLPGHRRVVSQCLSNSVSAKDVRPSIAPVQLGG
jgi:Rrf2 family protein